MGEKSDPRGGIRSQVRHNTEQVAANGFTFAALKYLVDQGTIDPQMAMMLMGGITVLLSAIFKAWSTLEMTPRIKTLISRWLPVAFLSLAVMIQGCAVQLGRSTPHEFTSITGETLVACEIVGISLAFGDADICRNAEGGHVSKTFADMTLGVIKVVGSAVAGFFSGLGGAGQGMQDALRESEKAPEAPSPAKVSVDPEARIDVPTAFPTNPFTGDIQ